MNGFRRISIVQRTLVRSLQVNSRRSISLSSQRYNEAAVEAQESSARLNFSTPYGSICSNEPIDTVILPGLVGEYGVTGEHQPVLSELKPGLVQIYRSDAAEPEKYFVSGGFAATHEDLTTDVSVAEAVELSELDLETATRLYAETKAAADVLPEDDPQKAKLQVEVETYEAICFQLGSPVA